MNPQTPLSSNPDPQESVNLQVAEAAGTPPPKRNSFVMSFIPKKDLTKFLPLVLILSLIASMPLAVFLVKQRRVVQKAEVDKVLPNRDSCNLVEVDVRETQACPRLAKVENGEVVPINPGQTNNITAYVNIYTLKNIALDHQSHMIRYKTYSSFCTTPYGQLYPAKNWIVCNDNSQSEEGEVTIEPGQAVEVRVERSSLTGDVCGTWQLDLDIFAVDGDESCIYRGPNPGETAGAWGYCETGIPCEQATPTPTPAVPTGTPTQSPLTPTATPSPTPSPTPIPTAPPEYQCFCHEVKADKDLENLEVGETITFTGWGKTNDPEYQIGQIKFTLKRGDTTVAAREMVAVSDRQESGWHFYTASFSYTIEEYGDYEVVIQVACPQGWQD